MRRSIVTLLACALSAPLLAEDHVYKRGDWVTVVVSNTQFDRGGQLFGHAQLGDSYCVGEQNDGRLWIPSVEGSLTTDEVIPRENAIEFFSSKIEDDPTNPWVHFQRAVFFAKAKAPNRARADADRAIQLSQEHAPLFVLRGNVLREIGQFEKARADYDAAIRLDPGDINGWNGRGLVGNDLMQYESAIKDFSTAIDLNPNASYPWSNRGLAYTELHQFEQAVSDFSTAISFAPRDPVPLRNRGDAYWRSGRWSAAFADYDAAIALPISLSDSYMARGDRYTELGFYREALTDYSAAIRLDLWGSKAFATRGWLLATCPDPKYRDPHQALLDGKLACDRTDFRNAHALRTYAAALAGLGRFDEALKWQNAATRFVYFRYDAQYQRIADHYERHEPYRLPRPKPRPPVEASRS